MIIIETGSTQEALDFVKDNLEKLGEIVSIEHERNKHFIKYSTIITGKSEVMHIIGGLTSGDEGIGTSGLISVLKLLGFNGDVAFNLVQGSSENIYSFKRHL